MYKQKRVIEGEQAMIVTEEPMIEDYISGKTIPATPEEHIRQIMAKKLVKEYNYSPNQIQTIPELRIKKGSNLIGPVDIAVFHNETKTQDNLYIIVETKREGEKEGLDQLKSYLSPTKANYGVWFNGKEITYIENLTTKPHWREIPDIPKKGETLEDIGLYRKDNLVPATELKSVFETCHNYIYANEGFLKEKVFNEVLKLIFMKMVDESDTSTMTCEFRITDKEHKELEDGKTNEFYPRIEKLFSKVKARYSDVFRNDDEQINLKPLTVAKIVSLLQKYSLIQTPSDVKGIAFQTIVHAHERGERGEFFTPQPIIDMAVKMLDPKQDEMVIDPACGSGGFLVTAMKHVYEKIDIGAAHLSSVQKRGIKESYARRYIKGIDINPDLTRVSKMHMIIYDDGHTGIFSENSLKAIEELNDAAINAGAGRIEKESFKIVLTNPPFGTKGKISNKMILNNYALSHKWKKQRGIPRQTDETMKNQVPDILFIERCLELLEDNGRMAIVLPDGILTNSTLEYVRIYIKENARILGVVSLPQETFIPHGTGSKTSLLLLQKVPKHELINLQQSDYPIFMAICKKIGYDIRGKPIYKKNKYGQLIDKNNDVVSNETEAVIDTDINEIIEAFKEFKLAKGLEF